MKKIRLILFALFLAALLPVVGSAQTKQVVLISIDGLRPAFYLDKGWKTPNLRRLMNQGTYAVGMRSVFPAYTYPSHTAMLTGAYPARSGIAYNAPIGSKGDWNWFLKDVRVPTLWQLLKGAGIATSAVEWPVSVGEGITYNVPEIWDNRHPSDRITTVRKFATPGVVEELERFATGKLDSVNMSEEHFSLDINSAKMAGYIFKKYRPGLLAVHFALVDGMEHEHGLAHDSVRLAVENVDRCVGLVLDSIMASGLLSSTTVLIVGDHGFSNINTVMRPNMLIRGADAKFVAAGGSCFLYGKKGSEKAVIDSLDRLPADKRSLFRVILRPELDRMGADSAALLALAAKPGLVFSGGIAPAPKVNLGPGTSILQDPLSGVFFFTSGGHHGYDPNIPEMWTGFIAWGAGIVKGGKIDSLGVVDIAPLIAKLLGVNFIAPDGKLPDGILVR